MRQYTLTFMEQRMGVARLTPMDGSAASASFSAVDDDAALAHIGRHLVDRLKGCVRGELSSMRIVPDPVTGGTRLLDDSHSNPNFYDTFITFNTATLSVDVAFESTRTALLADLPGLRLPPRTGSR